jgi:hypothetical protein
MPEDPPPSPIPAVRRSNRVRPLLAAVVLGAYPTFVLGTTYAITLQSDLEGGKHGPRDAYRHSLASAIVAWTLSPRFVEWTTAVMERDESIPGHRMDAHNNRVGIRVAARAADWATLRRSVRTAVDAGGPIDEASLADPDRIVWLPRDLWRDRLW